MRVNYRWLSNHIIIKWYKNLWNRVPCNLSYDIKVWEKRIPRGDLICLQKVTKLDILVETFNFASISDTWVLDKVEFPILNDSIFIKIQFHVFFRLKYYIPVIEGEFSENFLRNVKINHYSSFSSQIELTSPVQKQWEFFNTIISIR